MCHRRLLIPCQANQRHVPNHDHAIRTGFTDRFGHWNRWLMRRDSAWFIPKEWIRISRKLRDEALGLSLDCRQLCTEKKNIYIYIKKLKFSEQKDLTKTTHEQSVSVLGISTLEKVCLASTSLLRAAAKVVWYLREYRSQRSVWGSDRQPADQYCCSGAGEENLQPWWGAQGKTVDRTARVQQRTRNEGFEINTIKTRDKRS